MAVNHWSTRPIYVQYIFRNCHINSWYPVAVSVQYPTIISCTGLYVVTLTRLVIQSTPFSPPHHPLTSSCQSHPFNLIQLSSSSQPHPIKHSQSTLPSQAHPVNFIQLTPSSQPRSINLIQQLLTSWLTRPTSQSKLRGKEVREDTQRDKQKRKN